MGMTISLTDYSKCVGITYDSTRNRFAGLPYVIGGGVQRFALVDVLPTVRKSERQAVPALFKAADTVSCLFVGETIVPTARRVESWLNADESRRLHECRVRFTESLHALQTGDLFLFAERLRLAILIHPACLAFVLGLRPDQPNWTVFGPSFAITNARDEDVLTTYQKEPA